MDTVKALLIIDVQNDFIEGGSLGVTGGKEAANRISEFLTGDNDDYDVVITTQDWHVDPGSHFSDNPDFVNSWPVHCVAHTQGAEIEENLAERLDYRSYQDAIHKGQFSDSYSGFDGTNASGQSLEEILSLLGVTEIDLAGIALDYCVKESAISAVNAGWSKVTILRDLTAGINVTDENRDAFENEMNMEYGIQFRNAL